jgi:NAD(P)H-hydrate repair Nnr-like enzyme with NAD(P)H-hydrate epimerase domain
MIDLNSKFEFTLAGNNGGDGWPAGRNISPAKSNGIMQSQIEKKRNKKEIK